MEKIMKRMGREEPKHKIDFKVGEVVNITDGPFKGFDGSINEIDAQKASSGTGQYVYRETPELRQSTRKRVYFVS